MFSVTLLRMLISAAYLWSCDWLCGALVLLFIVYLTGCVFVKWFYKPGWESRRPSPKVGPNGTSMISTVFTVHTTLWEEYWLSWECAQNLGITATGIFYKTNFNFLKPYAQRAISVTSWRSNVVSLISLRPQYPPEWTPVYTDVHSFSQINYNVISNESRKLSLCCRIN